MDEHDLMEAIRDLLTQASNGPVDGMVVELLGADVRLTPGSGPSCEIAFEDGTTFVVSVTQIGGGE